MKLNHINSKNKKPNSSFYDLKAIGINGEEILMSDYQGKKILIVNVASKCGYTPQYESLQKLYEKNQDSLYILAFPSNDFLKQEPGTNEEIKTFCKVNFGVQFDIFEKISVKGNDIHPIYNWLSSKSLNGWNSKSPVWNFSKYLIDENGSLIGVWGPSIDPQSNEIKSRLSS
tara:strand:- start:558 stop:1073 length:516 start_codon:yes stop_codon:yes gene_type:complete